MALIKKFKTFDKYTKLSVIIIILFTITVFALASVYHISGDACWHASVSRFIANEQKIPLNEGLGRSEPFWAPPLFHIISAAVYSISGNIADITIKFISPIFAILTLIFTFLIVKKLFNSKIGFYTLLFLAFVPLFMDYSVFSYVESMLSFFVVLSIYFAIKNKILLASIIAGLGLLTKYNALVIIPLLAYIVYKNNRNKKTLIKNMSIVILLPVIITSPWLIRNWLLLGNPVWPFLNFIFQGLAGSSYTGFHIESLVNVRLITSTYLELFGVPNGNPQTFFFFGIPFLNLLFTTWIIGTLIFIFPLIYIFKIKKIKNRNLLSAWIILYVALFLVYISNVGFGVTRIIIPAIPALAIVWAHGLNNILNSKYRRIIQVIFILVISGFVFTEFTKVTLTANEWDFYSEDFDWVKSNTDKNALFMASGQCISYNINKQTINPDTKNIEKADYAFVNQNFRLDTRTDVDDQLLSEIRTKSDLVYSNDKTKTEIYKIK